MRRAILALALLAGVSTAVSAMDFRPRFGAGQTIAATTTSAAITLNDPQFAEHDLLIYNSGTVPVFCRWGSTAQTATTADVFIPPAAWQVFSKENDTSVACITASGTATVYIIAGHGQF